MKKWAMGLVGLMSVLALAVTGCDSSSSSSSSSSDTTSSGSDTGSATPDTGTVAGADTDDGTDETDTDDGTDETDTMDMDDAMDMGDAMDMPDMGMPDMTDVEDMTDVGGPDPVGACLNDADQAILATGIVSKEGQTCGIGCMGQPADCGTNCVVEKTGLTPGCAACAGGQINCAIEKCLSPCLTDAGGQACADCRLENCQPAYDECAGKY